MRINFIMPLIIGVMMFTLGMSNIKKENNFNNPAKILEKTIVETQNIIIKNQNDYKNNSNKLFQIINKHITPLLATNIIAQLLVGKEKWNQGDNKEKKKFIMNLSKLIANSYASNITQTGNYRIHIFPFSNNSWKKEILVVVKGEIINIEKNSSSDLSINMIKLKNGDWKIYDLSVAGVSIINSYKEQFQKYKTLELINKAIEKKNEK